MPELVLIYDGECALCNKALQATLKHNTFQNIYYAPFSSEFGKKVCEANDIKNVEPESLVFYKNGFIYQKSKAVFEVLNYLPKLRFLRVFSFLPYFFTDFIYDFVAKNRISWFGKSANCILPKADQKHLFL
jgi:predicted DCC family thiol-disulfide oxidoreductase YuxK